jgi:transposase
VNEYDHILNLHELKVIKANFFKKKIIFHIQSIEDKQVCPLCKEETDKIHSYFSQQLRDLSVSNRLVYLELTRRKFFCKKCTKIFTERFRSIEYKHIYTGRFEKYIFFSCFERSFSSVSRSEKIPYDCVRGIFQRYSKLSVDYLKKFDKTVRIIGLDEISIKKGHKDFQAIVSNINKGYVMEVLPDRKQETVIKYLQSLPKTTKRCIIYASIDMWEGYFNAIRQVLKKATIVIDRFHIMKNLNSAISKYRRKIQKCLPKELKDTYKGYRWILVKNEENMTEQQLIQLSEMKNNCPELKRIYDLRREFQAIFNRETSMYQARRKLALWEKKIEALGDDDMNVFLKTLCNWKEWILNYFSSGKLTNGFVEGMNNRIKLIKRVGYGYNNKDNFRLRVLVECGYDKLKLLKASDS